MRTDNLGDHLAHYLKDYDACAGISERVAQLASSHPLLFHAFVTGYGPLDARCTAIAAVERGESLREVCAILSVPYALRSIPASALGEPLQPAVITEDGARLAALRVNRRAHSGDQARCVRALFYGTSVCDEEFGLWLAHPKKLAYQPSNLLMVRSLAFYAWHSCRGAILPEPFDCLSFSAKRGWASNARTAAQWYRFLKFVIYFGDDPIADTWAEPYRCGEYEIIPLCTADELLDETLFMDNCLRTYADVLHRGFCRLFSVRRSGHRLGTVEIRHRRDGDLQVAQFRGPRNAVIDVEPWDAVHDWISRQKPMWARPCPSLGCARREDPFKRLLRAHQTTHALPADFWTGIASIGCLETEFELLASGPFMRRRSLPRQSSEQRAPPMPQRPL